VIARIETPWGPLWISGGADAVDRVSWSPIGGDPHQGDLDWIAGPLERYFLGKDNRLPGRLLFMRPGVLWARNPSRSRPLTYAQKILEHIAEIPYGSTMTYGEVAARTGNPRAARGVGSVCRGNPLPVVVPCHRVVGARCLGGYTPGLSFKRELLALERAHRCGPNGRDGSWSPPATSGAVSGLD